MMSQSLSTKEKLINSAIKIFAQKGYWKAKVSDIVNDAGVAQGTFYLYFNSKKDCLKKVLLILHEESISQMNNMLNSGANLLNIVIFFIKRVIKFKDISKVFLFEALASGDEFKDLYFQFKSHFRDILNKFSLKEEEISIILGTIREIIEQDILYENRDEIHIIEKTKKIFKILNL